MEYIGWLGAVLFIIAYLLLSLGYLLAEKPLYHVLNILGALCLIFNARAIDDYPNIAVNVVWGLIALVAIFNRKSVKKTENRRS